MWILNPLNFISGFILVNGIYNLSLVRSFRYILKIPQLRIEKNKIDLIIVSNPLCLKNDNKKYSPIVQIIHDTIPIQDPNHSKPLAFFNTLVDAHENKCVYVSSATKNIVKSLIKNKCNEKDRDIIRPLPSIPLEMLNNSLKIKSILEINNPYVLLNSSIVSWKKIEKSIQFFSKSNLKDRGFNFYIVGKIHNTKYSNYIKKLCLENNSIFLLDYVTEFEKIWLYLNSSLLLSTSSTEGFGIPFLDACSLNIPVIATNITSYKEIKNLFKKNNISLLELNQEAQWINKLNKVDSFNAFFFEKGIT